METETIRSDLAKLVQDADEQTIVEIHNVLFDRAEYLEEMGRKFKEHRGYFQGQADTLRAGLQDEEIDE